MEESLAYWHNLLSEYGFHPWYNLSTAFGFFYIRLNIATPLGFTFYGFITGLLYSLFKKGSLVGIIIYPIFYTSVFLWFATYTLPVRLFYAIYALLFLLAIEFILGPNQKTQVKEGKR